MSHVLLEDLYQLRFPSAPVLSPNGAHCAFLCHQADAAHNAYHTELLCTQVESGETSCIWNADALHSPFWEDDAVLRFLVPQPQGTLCKAAALQGDAPAAFMLPAQCQKLWKLAPGVYLALVTQMPKTSAVATVLEEIPYWANGASFTSGKRTQLYVYRTADGSFAPVSPADSEIGIVNVQGTRVLYSIRYRIDRKMKFAALRCYDAEANSDTELVPPDVYDIFWAAQLGDTLLVYASDLKRYGNVENPVFYRLENGQLTQLADYDEGPTNDVGSDMRYGSMPQFAQDGAFLYYMITRRGGSVRARVDGSGVRTVLTNEPGTVDGVCAAGGRVVFAAARENKAAELFCLRAQGEQRLTALNDAYFAHKTLAPVHHWLWQWEETELDGYIMPPVDYDPAKRYPGVLMIHGGPKFSYGDVFYHEMQLLCARGYFVFFTNPVGSDGRGNEFMDLRGRYGCEDYAQLMAFTDAVLARTPQIDPARLAVSGGSYGGFMVNWIIGHTQRFACAVSQRSISNMISMFCTGDTGYRFIADQCAATPWENAQKLWDQSPLQFADKAVTPTLFIHSTCDYRCPLGEALQMFTALRYHGVPTRACLLEGENHELSRSGRPHQRVRRLQEIIGWLDAWTKTSPATEKEKTQHG